MSYATRLDAKNNWVPESANIIIDRQDFIIYTWLGKLYVLAIFKIGDDWHVSMDLEANLTQLKELLS